MEFTHLNNHIITQANMKIKIKNSLAFLPYILFIIGLVYYCIFPPIILIFFPSAPISERLNEIFPNLYTTEYLYFVAVYLILFSIGYLFSNKLKLASTRNASFTLNTKALNTIATIIVSIITILLVRPNEIIHPGGYIDGYDIPHRGQLSTLFLTATWWYIFSKTSSSKKGVKSILLLCMVLSGINLLVLGTRLAVLTGLIAIIIFNLIEKINSSNHFNVNISKPLLLFVILALGLIVVGVLRDGTGLSLDAMLFIFFAESLFIYASVPAYFAVNDIDYFKIPYDLFSSIAGGIPTIFFTDKLKFFSDFTPDGPDYGSGFGGVNNIILLLITFGKGGFLIFSIIEGMFFSYLGRLINRNPFGHTIAICVISLLPFMFFRDGFQTSIKVIFFNFMLYPFLAMLLISTVRNSRSKLA